MTSVEKMYEDGDVLLTKIITNEDSTTKPVKLQKLIEEDEKLDEKDCWGCTRSFGQEGMDAKTSAIYSVFENNIRIAPPEKVYAMIYKAQYKLFVEKNPNGPDAVWSTESIKRHCESHMNHDIFMKIQDVRKIRKVESIIPDALFKIDTKEKTPILDAKTCDQWVRLMTKKYELTQAIQKG